MSLPLQQMMQNAMANATMPGYSQVAYAPLRLEDIQQLQLQQQQQQQLQQLQQQSAVAAVAGPNFMARTPSSLSSEQQTSFTETSPSGIIALNSALHSVTAGTGTQSLVRYTVSSMISILGSKFSVKVKSIGTIANFSEFFVRKILNSRPTNFIFKKMKIHLVLVKKRFYKN